MTGETRLRYSLGTEAEFRRLLWQIATLTGRQEFTLRLYPMTLHTYGLDPDHFTFEDHHHEQDIDCLECRTARNRRFALYVRCTDG